MRHPSFSIAKTLKAAFISCVIFSFALAGCRIEFPESSSGVDSVVTSLAFSSSEDNSSQPEDSSSSSPSSLSSSSDLSSSAPEESSASAPSSQAVSSSQGASSSASHGGNGASSQVASSRPASSTAPSSAPSSSSQASSSAPVEKSCSFQIDCSAALRYPGISSDLLEILPENGIFYSGTVVLQEGETVFDVLLRITRTQGIHLDFVESPALRTKYIRGIGNLYEIDCGSTSGWTYYVDNNFASTSCDQYTLQGGETVRWIYVTG